MDFRVVCHLTLCSDVKPASSLPIQMHDCAIKRTACHQWLSVAHALYNIRIYVPMFSVVILVSVSSPKQVLFYFIPKLLCGMHYGVCMKDIFMKTGTIFMLTGKLQVLDRLLRQLKADHHRVLIFTQMTRMLDVLEAFLNFHGHIYLRLDGTTRIDQRQVCVHEVTFTLKL